MKNALIVDGETFVRLPIVDTTLTVNICDITPETFGPVKKKLIDLYDEVNITADGKQTTTIDLDCAKEITVPPQNEFDKLRYNAADAMRVITRLTRDGDGCPWDRAQTHESIRINMIEEAYEAVDAIDKHDLIGMCEEFGDVLLQALLQSDMARRSGAFDFDDVCDGLCKKLISRHTCIFGEDSAGNADEALKLWDKAKATEKHYDSVKTILNKLPDTFPALLLAQKLHKKLKKAGYKSDPAAALDSAIQSKDYAAAIAACAALLSDNGKDAEVEVNKLVKAKINDVK
ncbi:MAG: MazG family protein [Clostridiales bacterium]|nr:MazG family protein [Clostridiales bacterium]